jgi:hypothetical protein
MARAIRCVRRGLTCCARACTRRAASLAEDGADHAGCAIATLEHAAVKYGDGFDEYANRAESAQFIRGDGGAGDALAAGERFPAIIADVLRHLGREAADCAA